MREIIHMVVVLAATAAVSGFSLALVRNGTAERIAVQEMTFVKGPQVAKIFLSEEAIPAGTADEALIGLFDKNPIEHLTELTLADGTAKAVFPAHKDGKQLGHALEGSGKGYGGAVSVMVGVTPDGTLAGIGITGHSETPGLGAKCTEAQFLDQFRGMPAAGGVARAADGGQVEAISGATITTVAVVDAVNDALTIYERNKTDLAAPAAGQ